MSTIDEILTSRLVRRANHPFTLRSHETAWQVRYYYANPPAICGGKAVADLLVV